jgi:hypothetical protein
MSRHTTIRATLAIAAAALAFGATSAGAMPTRDGTPPLKAPHSQEFDAGHASLAQEQAQALAAQQAQTLDKTQGTTTGRDLRWADSRTAAILAQRNAAQATLQGPPKFSTTKVTALHSAQPLTKDDGNDIPLIGIILGLAGAGILGAGAAVATSKTTRSRRTRIAA